MGISSFYEDKQIFQNHFYLSACFDHFNSRLRILDYRGNVNEIADEIIKISTIQQYSKAIIYARREHVHVFVEKGFLLEAIFEGFFNGSHGYALTMYFDQARKHNDKWIKEDEILRKVIKATTSNTKADLPTGYLLRKAVPKDAKALTDLYSKVFEIYPTPLNEPSYIKDLMKKDTIFYVIENDNELVSAASAYIERTYHNAEISDCATLPAHRKHGLLKHLIVSLEKELRDERIFCAYSLARSLSYGMNAALQQLQYKYKGRMTNNCYIFDKLEDMNVWVKDLAYD